MDGVTVRAIRLNQQLTQQAFANKIGVSAQTIQAVETGKRAVSDRVRYRIAQIFGVDDATIECIRRAKLSDRLIV